MTGSMQNHVSGGDLHTVDAVREIIAQGGNAFDGIVAGAFVAMVSESTLTSAGGGGYLMISVLGSEPVLLDFFNTMPSGPCLESLDFHSVSVDYGPAQQEFHIGRGAAGVPGNILGLLFTQEQLGRLNLGSVLAPAIVAAREGVALSAQQAMFIRVLEPILTNTKEAAELYAPKGRLLGEGDILVMEQFSGFLENLAETGSALIQTGTAAGAIVEWASKRGLICADDLAQYQVEERKPLKLEFNDYEILLNPEPAPSGEFISHTLSQSDISTVRGLANAMKATAIEGHQLLDPPSSGSTTHLSVIDADGNAASLTMTNGEGCGSLLPDYGFMMNNVLGEADLNPNGFHQHQPGQRLPSMMAPTIVLKNGAPVLATGTGGSSRIRSVIIQVLINILQKGMTLEEATLAPRMHYDGQMFQVEPGFTDQDMNELRSIGPVNVWDSLNLYFGGAHSVTLDEGFGDPRRSGHSISFI